MNDFASKKKMLIPFDVLFDLDFGIAKLVEKEFAGSQLVDKFIFHNCDERVITYLLEREDENPLTVVMNEGHGYNLLYKQLWEKYRYEIYSNAKITSVINMISMSNKLENLDIKVSYSNEMELDFLENNIGFINGSLNTIPINEVDLNDYDGVIYSKTSKFEEDIDKYKKDVQIYILKARYNLDLVDGKFLIKKHIIEKYPEHLISIMESYRMTSDFFSNG